MDMKDPMVLDTGQDLDPVLAKLVYLTTTTLVNTHSTLTRVNNLNSLLNHLAHLQLHLPPTRGRPNLYVCTRRRHLHPPLRHPLSLDTDFQYRLSRRIRDTC
jgi:hypothetical protein